ncbi:MAG: DinB family protein [Acidobacteriota bacterium]
MATRRLIESIRAEYERYKALAEGAISQIEDHDLVASRGSDANSVATVCWHISGNLRSRFTNFLTEDGEKSWRTREEEFDPRQPGRAELLAKWEEGWQPLFVALAELTDEDLDRTVTIRRQPLKVYEALHRSLAHTSYHVGQIVLIAKETRGDAWKSLSIPRGQSDAFNRASSGGASSPPGPGR